MDDEPRDLKAETENAQASGRPAHQDWRVILVLMLLALGAAVLLLGLSLWAR